jgi:hypothetical protein
MAVHNPNYEVPWQLPEDDYGGEYPAAKLGGTALAVDERSSSLARFGALLAGADFAAVVVCSKESMTVELADPPTPWLPPGLVLANERCLGPAAKGAVTSLLAGRSAWSDCLPPSGFRSAALITAPVLALSSRLVFVASSERRLDKRSLGLAAAYLSHAGASTPRIPEPAPVRPVAAWPASRATSHVASLMAASGLPANTEQRCA